MNNDENYEPMFDDPIWIQTREFYYFELKMRTRKCNRFNLYMKHRSTLLNDVFRKKIPSREVYFCPWYMYVIIIKKINFFIKKIQNGWRYTSQDRIFFLNSSLKSVKSTLLNDAFRKKIPSQKVYFRSFWNFLIKKFNFFDYDNNR